MQNNKCGNTLAEIANDKEFPTAYDLNRQVFEQQIFDLVSEGRDYDDIILDSVIDSTNNPYVSSLIDNGIDVKAAFIAKKLDVIATWAVSNKLRKVISKYVDEHDFLLTDGVIH